MHVENIKDFTHINLKNLKSIRLPERFLEKHLQSTFGSEYYLSFGNDGLEFFDVDSIDEDAFNDFPFLTSLHLRLAKHIQVELKHLKNLKELCLETMLENESSDIEENVLYFSGSFPLSLEKLSVIGFNLKLRCLSHLKNLTFLELFRIRYILINESRPFDCFTNLKHLYIHNSTISFEASCHVDNKVEIQLVGQRIEEIKLKRDGFQREIDKKPKIFFENLSQLKKLYLNAYNLYEIDVGSFKRISTLEDLTILLTSFEPRDHKGLLDNFIGLRRLTLKGVKSLEENFFDNLFNLEFLDLYDNQLRRIYWHSFVNLKKLTSLNVSYNALDEIDVDAFKNLNQLVTLDLSFNRLEKLETGLFKNLTCLEKLNLEGNQLNKMGPGLFEGLKKCKILNLSSCELVEIEVNTFESLIELESLDLSNNNFKEIKEGTFDNTKNLKYLYLGK